MIRPEPLHPIPCQRCLTLLGAVTSALLDAATLLTAAGQPAPDLAAAVRAKRAELTGECGCADVAVAV